MVLIRTQRRSSRCSRKVLTGPPSNSSGSWWCSCCSCSVRGSSVSVSEGIAQTGKKTCLDLFLRLGRVRDRLLRVRTLGRFDGRLLQPLRRRRSEERRVGKECRGGCVRY